jgi:pimeloyl-ACP methyl ester carboxylesterase
MITFLIKPCFFLLILLISWTALIDTTKAELPKNQSEKELVVLLHGIAKSARSMRKTERALTEAGYKTLNITYPSTKKDLEDIAHWLHEQHLGAAFTQENRRVHFVTHSMGGLVIRRYLERYKELLPPGKLGRVVMLAPPNGGSEVADLIHGLAPYNWYYGPAGQELTTAARESDQSDIYYPLGIIAGTKEWPYIAAAFVVPGPGDGRVSVKKTKLPGMQDHVTVSGTHTFIMNRKDVHAYIIQFLRKGRFTDEP